MQAKWYMNRKVMFSLLAVILLIGISASFLVARTSGRTGIGDSAAFRSKPRAGGAASIDPGVLAQGNGAWQGDTYISAARSALALVNAQRVAASLPELRWDDNLAACAMVRATELPASFSHTRPNGQDWYTVCPDLMFGENLAFGFSTAEAAVNAWMNSAEHKQNILTPGYKSCGIGIYEQNGTWYWNQEFGYY